MILYILYRIGYFLALVLPLKVSYGLATLIADIYCCVARDEKTAIINNLKVILGSPRGDKELSTMASTVFRNFAKYLVDFFRFSTIDDEYIKKFIKIDGLENVDRALAKGNGAIMLSAHIGNWELGGFVVSLLGHPMSAVVLTHENKKINDFFTKQRRVSNLQPVEIGMGLRSCYEVLKNNGLLALLGDRDFSKNGGLCIKFFGKKTLVPKGPATFSYRLGSGIVPSFMIREADDTFRLSFEPPIFPQRDKDESTSVKELTERYSAVIESYVKKYPTQWYMFGEVWNNNGKPAYPDTII